VSKIYAFLSRWTKFDAVVLSAYSAAIFARTARKYAFTPRIWGVQAIAGIVIAVVMFVGACALFMVAVKQYGLDAYGIETVGTVTDVSFRLDSKTEWETVIYEFTTHQGATSRPNYTDRFMNCLAFATLLPSSTGSAFPPSTRRVAFNGTAARSFWRQFFCLPVYTLRACRDACFIGVGTRLLAPL
jgi:hypothetical protein